MSEAKRITYTTVGSSEEFHREFERALESVAGQFGAPRPSIVGGERLEAGEGFEIRSPIDRRILLGRAYEATAEETGRAIRAARAAFPAWRDRGWRDRVAVLRAAAERIADRKYELAAWMAYEVGKNRLEAMAEVEESADLLRYYCGLVEENAGYAKPMARMSPTEETESVFLPYGVWGVISPFNFPLALAAGMVAGALVTGNTVVFKPSSDAPVSGHLLYEALREGGVPEDALHLVFGSGSVVGEAILRDPETAGVAFTGSSQVGMRIYKDFAGPYPKPVVIEMGGKNPAIVTASADLEAAAEGVARSAFGFAGQKCSACSRAYVEESVRDSFLALLLEKTKALKVGNPLERDVFLGPVVNERAHASYGAYVGRVREAGGDLLYGGDVRRDGDLAHGLYVDPAIAYFTDPGGDLFHEEMFLPILLVAPVRGLDEAIELSNRAPYGLTAGLFSTDADEVRRFLDNVEAGVTYVNRRSGATTGAWPGVNPFGGWKASGSTGPAALGPYYPLKFMREQSRTVNR
jgi:1-pyrroline-5-carboxylate dehydrogenase